MNEPVQPIRVEPRWPVEFAIGLVVAILAFLPGRVRLFAAWLPYFAGFTLILPMIGVRFGRAKYQWLRIEHTITLIFCVAVEVATIATLSKLISAMIYSPGAVGGLELLASSIAVWLNNVLAFSLLYWKLDGGAGEPDSQLLHPGKRPDWLFPQTGVPEQAPPGWRPTYIDYLFLSFSTATAFSTTDVMPLTSRAKILMMLESAVSLSTIAVVAARAINILGG